MRVLQSKPGALLLLFLALMAAFTAFRLAFLGHFEGFGALGSADLTRSLALGAKFDARLAALLVAPLWLLLKAGEPGPAGEPRAAWGTLLLGAALGTYVVLVLVAMTNEITARPWLVGFLLLTGLYRGLFRAHGLRASRGARWVWGLFAWTLMPVLLLGYFVDFGSYAYIHTRLNGMLLMFLENAATSLRMMWETYPILRLAAALAAISALAWWGLTRLARRLAPCPGAPGLRRAVQVAGSLLLLFAMYGKWSRYPLRWAEAFEARTAFHAQLALNPILFFLETRAEMDGGYDLEAVKASHALLADYFGTPPTFDAAGNPSLAREGVPRGRAQGRPNLVFIQLESLSYAKTGLGGNPLRPTPFLDELAAKSLCFDRFHVVMENTSRSMFATLFGIPDVSSVQNATRNPLLVDQHSVLSALEGYESSFWLGGSANWAQIRGVMKNNFKDLAIFEEGSFRAPVVDVWGVSDADLLLEANAHLKARPGPFWAYLQTSGNHPPFTIPAHFPDFQVETRAPEDLKAARFIGNDEFNSVRFLDYSLRRYFEAAEREPYFRNTVFVLWADHGIPRGNTDPRFGDLTLAIHHIPCLIYAPGLGLEPRRIQSLGNQMDLLPTVLSLLGRPYRHQTLGKDLLDPAWETRGAAFTFTTFRRPPRLGLLQEDWYLNLEPDGRPALYRLEEPDPRDRSGEEPARTARMKALAQGFYHWSKYLLSHNKPMKATP